MRRDLRAGAAALGAVAAVLAAGLAGSGAALAGHDGAPTVPVVRSDYVKALLDAREPVVLVDFRKASEFRAGHLPGAISVPLSELDRRYREIPATARLILYCQCPIEEIATAYAFLQGQGYRNQAVLEDGVDGWLRHRYPLVR
jgi:rhodanese-related sulfurtransferase